MTQGHNEEAIDINYDEILRETENAKLFKIGEDEVWLPRSSIEHTDAEDKTVSIPEWLAKDRGLI